MRKFRGEGTRKKIRNRGDADSAMLARRRRANSSASRVTGIRCRHTYTHARARARTYTHTHWCNQSPVHFRERRFDNFLEYEPRSFGIKSRRSKCNRPFPCCRQDLTGLYSDRGSFERGSIPARLFAAFFLAFLLPWQGSSLLVNLL